MNKSFLILVSLWSGFILGILVGIYLFQPIITKPKAIFPIPGTKIRL